MKLLSCAFLGCLLAGVCVAQGQPAQSVEELQNQLERVIRATHTPGLSIAIVRRDAPDWCAGLGMADIASHRAATAHTLFRVGSVSKLFPALAILKLAGEGKLSLHDPLRRLAPEVWFQNPWEATDPVRVVHLLEHTTGWEGWHLHEVAHETPPQTRLREALDYDHHSRASQWRPGTRMAYSNSGPAVAAYLVEKIAGEPFEDYVRRNFFAPIGMPTATFFPPPPDSLATLYRRDNVTPYPYWNMIERPPGALNASATDMAACLHFFLHRGVVGGVGILPAVSIDRMEIPTTTWAARAGLQCGYGLGNTCSVRDGFVYRGHDGAIPGSLSKFEYLPDYGAGYFYAMNSSNPEASAEIGEIVQLYITRDLKKPAVPPPAPLPARAADYAGWYELDSPRIGVLYFAARLYRILPLHLVFDNQEGQPPQLRAGSALYAAVGGTQFRRAGVRADPIATVALLATPEGRSIQLESDSTVELLFKQIPAWLLVVQFLLAGFVLLSMASVLLYAPFWIVSGRSARRPAEFPLQGWPLAAVLCVAGAVAVVRLNPRLEWPASALANMNGWSLSVFAMTLMFAAASLGSAAAWCRAPRQGVRFGVRIYSAVITVALLVAACCLAHWGFIGYRSWAQL